MFNPAKAADEIKKGYVGYISTTYHFRNQDLQTKLLEELDKTVSNGPFVDIKDSFKSGKSIEELIDKGILSPLFRNLEKDKNHSPKLPLSRPLYLHQEKAIEKIVAGNNVVVSTGTGSGKTDCFVIPVINELLREKEQGKLNEGVRAIFIYPMNALANDQIKSLREILMAFPDIRFGVYNGGTENREEDAIKLYEAMYANEKYPELRKRLPNEEVSREKMKEHPPHILFTNYAMLEHMLFRPGDDTIFSNSNFKYVVLDEAHVYAGATGIETAFLMGRLKGRIKGERKPQFILTSATLGDGSEPSNKRVVEFAKQLTGCKFNADDVITAYRDNMQKSSKIKQYPIQLFTDLANEELSFEDVINIHNLNFVYSKEKEAEILYEIISSSHLYAKMRSEGSLISCDSSGWGNAYLSTMDSLEMQRISNIIAKKHEDGSMDFSLNTERIQAIIDLCKIKNIEVLLVNMPVFSGYLNRLNPAKLRGIEINCEALTNNNSNVTRIDFLRDSRFRMNDFRDPDHLNAQGAKTVSLLINEYLQ